MFFKVANLIKAIFGGNKNVNLTSYVGSATRLLPKPVGEQVVGLVSSLSVPPNQAGGIDAQVQGTNEFSLNQIPGQANAPYIPYQLPVGVNGIRQSAVPARTRPNQAIGAGQRPNPIAASKPYQINPKPAQSPSLIQQAQELRPQGNLNNGNTGSQSFQSTFNQVQITGGNTLGSSDTTNKPYIYNQSGNKGIAGNGASVSVRPQNGQQQNVPSYPLTQQYLQQQQLLQLQQQQQLQQPQYQQQQPSQNQFLQQPPQQNQFQPQQQFVPQQQGRPQPGIFQNRRPQRPDEDEDEDEDEDSRKRQFNLANILSVFRPTQGISSLMNNFHWDLQKLIKPIQLLAPIRVIPTATQLSVQPVVGVPTGAVVGNPTGTATGTVGLQNQVGQPGAVGTADVSTVMMAQGFNLGML
jgi:hypothetical protein